jgi:hypothetical protein
VTPANSEGTVDVVVNNADGQSSTLADGFTYTASSPPPAPAPTITAISPSGGPTTGGTAVTINGTNFATGATVTFDGMSATNINVVSNTSIEAVTPAHSAGPVDVAVTNADGQTGTLANGYTYAQASTVETVLLEDDFNDNTLDTSKWSRNLFSGFTDLSLPLSESSQHLLIGPLLSSTSGSHYAGIRSISPFDFSNAYCQVEVLEAASASTSADTMLTIGRDVNGYYRIYVEGGSIFFQKRVAGAKVTLLSATYNAANDRYWRIRHEASSGRVIFETAADNGGVAGSWVVRYSEVWNNSAIPLSGVIMELKGGTWQSESNAPGRVIFDNFRAAKP